jgi:TolB protein
MSLRPGRRARHGTDRRRLGAGHAQPAALGLAAALTLVFAFPGSAAAQSYGQRLALYDTTGVASADARAAIGGTPPSERILYTVLRPSNLDIFLLEPGGEPRRLTVHPGLDYNPVLSPDGRWLVYTSEHGGNADLYGLDLRRGGPPVRLTTHAGMDDAPAFSPDGRTLAFVSTRGGDPDVWLMPFRPGDRRAEARAVNLTRSPYGDFNPAFSPDGRRIAFSSNRHVIGGFDLQKPEWDRHADTHLYVVGIDGRGLQRLTEEPGINGSPAWTADGRALLFHRAEIDLADLPRSTSAIWRVELLGGEKTRLTPEGIFALTPAALPDGGVVFASIDLAEERTRTPFRKVHGGRLYRMDAGGTTLTRLTEPQGEFLAPTVHAASGRLVFSGEGPDEGLPLMASGVPFARPGAPAAVRLGGQVVEMRPLAAYFASAPSSGTPVVAVQWVHERNGNPPGPSPIVAAGPGGDGMRTLVTPADSGFLWAPVVTSDGEWVFYAKGPRFGRPGTRVDIWKARPDGTGAVNLTATSEANDAFPDISADGRRVVFRSGRTGNHEIFVMGADGANVRQLTRLGGTATMPTISPDGRWVVYTAEVERDSGMKLRIQAIDDPEDHGRLLEPRRAALNGQDMHPRFSPDGRWVVFVSDRGGYLDEWVRSGLQPQPYGELYAVPLDGGPAVRLTHDKWEDGLPFWGRVDDGR